MNGIIHIVRRLIIFVLIIAPSVQAQVSDSRPAKANEYIVKMKTHSGQGDSQNQKAAFNREASQKGVRLMQTMGKTVRVIHQMPETAMMQIQASSKSQVDYLKSHPDVEFVEPNYILSSIPTEVGPMGAPPQSGDSYSQSYSAVKVTESWNIAKPYNNSSAKTIVAVIDTGLDTSHGVFHDSNSIWVNQAELNGLPGVDDDGDGYIDDVYGWNFQSNTPNVMDDNEHGTHVAGIVLGVGQDILENPVRESRIRIMPLKFLDQNGSGSTSDAINAITYAVNKGAKVINNSWGGGGYSRALHEAYTYAYNHDVVVVSAAGNSHDNIDSTPMYPAALDTPSNITVAATTDSDNLASFSNYSVQGLVHVAAPGSGILSTVPGSGCSYPGCYRYMSGTSMAAPFVAGLSALVIRESPQLSAYQVKGIILGTIDYKSNLNNKVQTSGRVNALKAVQAGIDNIGTAYWLPSYSPAYKTETRSVASDSDGGSGGGCGLVKVLAEGSGDSGAAGGASEVVNILVVLFLMGLPLAMAAKLRHKKPAYVRQHSRFNLAKKMQIKINDQVMDLTSNSVSVGGFSFSKNVALDKGQKIKVKFGDQMDEVDAEIVWNRENNAYGVKFSQITDAIKKEIESWTAGLVPTSC